MKFCLGQFYTPSETFFPFSSKTVERKTLFDKFAAKYPKKIPFFVKNG